MNLGISQVLLIIVIFNLLLSLIFYPSGILVSDEYSYVLSGLLLFSFDSLEIFPLYQEYLPGFPFFLGLFAWIFGKSSVFMVNIILFHLALWISYKTIEKKDLPTWPVLLYFVFYPALMGSRVLMSETLSILLASLVVWGLMTKPKKSIFFAMAFVTVLSFLVKESTLILLLIPLVYLGFQRKYQFTRPMIFALLFGVGCVLLSINAHYGSLVLRDPGQAFEVINLWKNLPLLLLIFILLFPILPLVIAKTQFEEKKYFLSGIIPFTLIHAFYGYNGWEESGFKSLFLYTRYFTPMVPFVIVFLAYWVGIQTTSLLRLSYIFSSIILIIAIHFSFSYLSSQHHRVSQDLGQFTGEGFSVFRNSESVKFVNPLSDIKNVAFENNNWTSAKGNRVMIVDRSDTKVWKDINSDFRSSILKRSVDTLYKKELPGSKTVYLLAIN